MNYIKSLQAKITELEARQPGGDADCPFNPQINPKAISLIQQEDGNWKGWMSKFGKVVEVRQSEPQIVLQMLLTHPGE